jgi:hypothetical protein
MNLKWVHSQIRRKCSDLEPGDCYVENDTVYLVVEHMRSFNLEDNCLTRMEDPDQEVEQVRGEVLVSYG